MDLSIIIVSWNVKEKLRENLKSIYKSIGDLSYEVFVVDNNSKDATVEMVRREFPKVKLIDNNDNLGFAKANNQAIKRALGEFILLLNPDMRLMDETLIKMVKWMRENKRASVAGCRLVDERGNTIKQVRRFPAFYDQLVIVLKLPHLFPGILKKYIRDDFDYSKAAQVDSIRGGFFMIRREIIDKIGLLDEKYFLWFEEVDYCRQIVETGHGLSGGEAWYTPAARCLDYISQSFKQVDSVKKQKYFRDSMLIYFKKWHPAWQYYILKLTWPMGIFLTWLFNKIKINSRART